MLAQLDYATRSHHVHADSARIALLSGPITRDLYEDYLARTFAFEAPVEARLQKTIGLDSIVDLRLSLRAGFLLTDLTTLGTRPQDPPITPDFVGVEQALGWIYVVERGRRMNGLLYRHLMRRLPEELAIAGNYLHASNPLGARWQQLGTALDRFAANHVIVDQILNAAHRAFRCLRQHTRPVTAQAA